MPSQLDVERHFVFLVFPLESEDKDAEGLEKEAPDDTEGVRFTKHINLTAGEDDRQKLQPRYEIDDPERRAVFSVRFLIRLMEHAVFGHAIHHAIGPDDRRVYGFGKNQD